MKPVTLEHEGCRLTIADVGDGIWFAYGFENEGRSVTAPAVVIKMARRYIKEHGGEFIQQHRTGQEPDKVNQFWDRYGFQKAYEVYELPV